MNLSLIIRRQVEVYSDNDEVDYIFSKRVRILNDHTEYPAATMAIQCISSIILSISSRVKSFSKHLGLLSVFVRVLLYILL